MRPDIVNALVNRLYLIPVLSRDAQQVAEEFSVIRAEFKQLYGLLGTRRLSIYGIVQSARYQPSEELGTLSLVTPTHTHQIFLAHGSDRPEQKKLQEIMARAGKALPKSVRETVKNINPTSPFAEWVAVMWKHSTLPPCQLLDVELSVDGRQTTTGGVQWTDPIPASLFVIDSLDLAKRRFDELKILDSDWSSPMSKTEFAKRLFGDRKRRSRDIDPIFDSYEKVQISKKKWIFRLDTLPMATRKKLEP